MRKEDKSTIIEQIAAPYSQATPAPLAVMILPSIITPLSTRFAPFNSSSKPGKQVAFLPFKRPFLPKIKGAAQIAPIILLFSAQ